MPSWNRNCQWECIFAMGTSFANKIPNGKIRHTFMSRLLRTFPPSPLGSLWIMRLHCKFCSLKREGIFSSPCLTASFFCVGHTGSFDQYFQINLVENIEIFANSAVNCYNYLFYKDHTNKLEIRPLLWTKWKDNSSEMKKKMDKFPTVGVLHILQLQLMLCFFMVCCKCHPSLLRPTISLAHFTSFRAKKIA